MKLNIMRPKFITRLYANNYNWWDFFKLPCMVNKTISLLVIVLLLPNSVFAHRGVLADANEVDACRIWVGYERIHFSAYTPTFTGSKTYCEAIPDIGPTNLVFDYEGKKLRNVTLEFEVTKEPEGSRVFYQAPKKIKTGTVNAVVDFRKFGAGEYLAHVTIVHKGKKLDQHIPFSVGKGEEFQISFNMILLAIIAIILLIYYLKRVYEGKEDQTGLPRENME